MVTPYFYFSVLITCHQGTCDAILEGGERNYYTDENGFFKETHWLLHDNSMTRAARRIRRITRCPRSRWTVSNYSIVSLIHKVFKENKPWWPYYIRWINGHWESCTNPFAKHADWESIKSYKRVF